MATDHKEMRVFRQSEKGQIALEYILILLACVSVATIISTTMTSRSEEGTGFMIARWVKLTQAIGSDSIEP